MTSSKLVILILCCFIFSYSYGQKGFEGHLNIKHTNEKTTAQSFKLKDHKIATTKVANNKKMTMISNIIDGNRWTIMESKNRKVAAKQNIFTNSAIARQKIHTDQIFKQSNTLVEKTEIRKKIGGYECVKIKGKNEIQEGEAWVCPQLNINFLHLFPHIKFRGKKEDMLIHAFAQKGFIMEMWIRNLDTKKIEEFHAQVIPQDVNDSIFILDDTYEIIDMTNMREIMRASKKDPQKLQLIREMMNASRGF